MTAAEEKTEGDAVNESDFSGARTQMGVSVRRVHRYRRRNWGYVAEVYAWPQAGMTGSDVCGIWVLHIVLYDIAGAQRKSFGRACLEHRWRNDHGNIVSVMARKLEDVVYDQWKGATTAMFTFQQRKAKSHSFVREGRLALRRMMGRDRSL